MAKAVASQRKKQIKSGMTEKSESFFDKYIKGDKFKKDKKSPPKKSESFFNKYIKGDRLKKDKADTKKGMVESKMKSTIAKAEKKYAKESMFKKAADARDTAKTTPGKARPFKEAFDSATKADKDSFMWKGKSYFTTRGAAENRDKKKTRIAPKGTYPKKSKLDADTVKSYKKRIAWMKKRKEAGKGYAAKNLAELEAKLKDM